MDPITAVGFAASILQFIEFGYKLTMGTLNVLKTGSLSEYTHISIVINDYRAVIKPLSQPPSGKSDHEVALQELAKSCQAVAQKLSELLEKLRTDPNCSTWKSLRVALRSMRKKGKVADLEDLLSKYRAQIMTRLALILK